MTAETATNVSIEEAVEKDVPEMIAVHIAAMEADVLTAFLYGRNHTEAVRKQTEALTVLRRRFTHPTNRCHIHKAVDKQSGELVGWSLVRWEDGNIAVPPETEGIEEDFIDTYRREVLRNWVEISEGKPHVVLGGLYVRPGWQGRGVGRRLVDHVYEQYNLSREPVIVQTRASAEGFWKKLGWETVVCAEFDLSKWTGGSGTGYGMHRSPQMLRYPKAED